MSAPKAAIGAFGLDRSAANPAVKAGDDFFAHASGKWFESFAIPEDKTSYGPFQKIADDIEPQLRSLIEAAAAAPGVHGSASQQVGDFYASFMDEAAIEKADLAPIAEDLSRIDAASDKKAIAALFGAPGMPSAIKIHATPDAKRPDRYSLEISRLRLGWKVLLHIHAADELADAFVRLRDGPLPSFLLLGSTSRWIATSGT